MSETKNYQNLEDSLTDKINNLLKNQTAELKTVIEAVKAEVHREIHLMSDKITELEEKCTGFQKRCVQLERHLRKNNLVVFGLDVGGEDLLGGVIAAFDGYLGVRLVETDFGDLYKLGKQGEKTPPLKIELNSHYKKLEILKNSKRLKGTAIYIANDLCKEDRLDQRILVQHKNELKNRHHKTVIRGNKLIIDGRGYTADQLENLEKSASASSLVGGGKKSISAPSTPDPNARSEELNKEFGYSRLAREYQVVSENKIVRSQESQKAEVLPISPETGAIRKQISGDFKKASSGIVEVKQRITRTNSSGSATRSKNKNKHC